MSNRLIAESRRNDVIIKSLNLCTLYYKVDNFLLMIIFSKLIVVENRKKKKKKFMFVEFLFQRHFLEIDLEICRCLIFVWFLWSLRSKFEYWLSWKDKEADNLISLKTRHWRRIWLFDWWQNRMNKRFWLVDELRDAFIRKIFVK